MIRILSTLTLLLCFAFTAVNAQVITAERAAEIANSFFSAGVQKSAAARGVVSSPSLTSSFDSNDVTETASAEPTFYVLTNPEGGFVIVSGEETENPIIGYSLDGTIDVNNLPDGFVGYMTDIDAQVKSLREYNANNPQKAAAARNAMARAADYEYNATTMGNIVKNLNTAPWGQRTPFNKLCPVVGTGNAVTGCVPTAYSILCRYYEWPEQGAGTVYNPSTGDPLQLGHTYDYASMRNDNYPSGYTDAEATAVATLMRDMGYAYTASYGSGTTTTSSENPSNLIKYFGFKCETPLDHGNGCTKYEIVNNMEQWVTYIKNCLNAGYPIPYSSTTALDAQDRHIYILDGYTDNNYFHFNWGWFGSGNGWFTLDNMVPDDYSNYSKSHRAYFNVIPDKTTYTVTATAEPSNMGTVSINGGTAGSSATANLFSGATATLTAHPAQGYALASWTKNDVVVGSRNTIEVTVGTDANDYIANFDDAANVLVVKDYVVNTTNGSLNNGSNKSSIWTSTDNQPTLTLKTTADNDVVVQGMSVSTGNHKFYATAYDVNGTKAYTNVTYTLSVPEGYVIKDYTMTYIVGTANQISLNGELLTSTGTFELSATPNAQTASFTLSVPSAGQQYITVKSIAVTVQSEGGGSTPTPDPEPEPTPTTYNITAEASPQNAGNVAINGGTQSTVANIDATSGSTVSLQAYPNSGYEFAGWYDGTTKVSSNNPYSITATAAISYIASFQEVQQGGSSSTNLAGKYFRLKEKSTGIYMNIANTDNNEGSTSGVTVVAKNESSDTQVFLFEQSGNGYKLKANSGNYIKCHAWNANANTTSANDATVLTFETTGKELEYLIKWNNTNMNEGVERDDYFKTQNVDGITYVYCDAASTAAATWVLEEVIPSNENTLDVTFNNATYTKTDGTELTSGWGYQVVTQTTPAVTIKVAETINNFGYTTGVISGVKTPYLYKNTNFILSISEQYKITGYRITVRGQDNSYSGDFTCSVGGNETSNATLSGTTTQTLSATGLDTNIINISVGGTSGNGIFITALEITYVENEFEPLPFKAEIDGWRNDNPNTHLGTITIGGTAMKLTPEHLNASELTMPLNEGTALAFTRKYRGFEFNGFYIGATSLGTNPTLTADNVAAIDENNPLIAKFTATDDVTLFYDDDEFSYRIPAIVKTVKDDKHKLIAISDYRHSFDDIGCDNHKTGTTQVDLVIRTSEDNGATWTAKQTIAEGSQHFGYGDAAAVANGQDLLVMAVAGNVFYAYADSENPQQAYRIYSNDNGVTWEKEDISSNMESLFPDYYGLFFGSGKLAVDPDFNGSGNARVYGAILMKDSQGERNYVLYSDNWGKTWNILGNAVAARQNEPKVEILPNGQILLSARRGGGRTFNVFTYTDKANSTGTWSTVTDGCNNGGNTTNGEIICLDAKRPNGKPTKILLQSQPYGSDRRNVSIWYKEISANETYTASSIASGWTKGKQVSTQLSAYSAMCLQENGEIALFFEEAPCYGGDHTKGYSMVYVPLTIEEITENNFLNPNADVEYVPVEFNIVLTDTEGNTYRETIDDIPSDVAAVESYLTTTYPFITLGAKGNLQGSDKYYTYTNTVTLPFKVSNANTTVWHNIYWPANGTSVGQYYPIYLMAENEKATAVAKITEEVHYGNSQYNTYNYADKLAWAVYSVNNTLTFKFKNKLTGKFMAVTGVSSDNTNNVVYTDEAGATAFTLEKYTGGNASYGNYAIKSVYNSTTGYVCNTSVGYTYATNYPGTGHPGAWAKIVESPDYWTIYENLIEDIGNFGAGNGKYTENDDINNIDIDALASMPLNSLNTKAEEVQNVKESYREVVLAVNDAETATVPGTISITVNGSEAETVNNKFVPANATVSILATANPGYRFVNWTRPAAQASAVARTAEARNSDVVSDQNPYTVTVSEALNLVANFAKNSYTVNVSTNGTGGSATTSAATVEHGGEVTLTAVADSGYKFAGWYNGETKVSSDAEYTVTNVTSDINYTARFSEAPTGTVAIHIRVASTDGTTVTNAVNGDVKAIINNIGQEWATDADFVVGADVELVASSDYDNKAYLFDGWYKNGVLVDKAPEITVKATEVATYEARFFRGCVVIGEPKSNIIGYVTDITLSDGTSLGYDASNRAVVKKGTEVKINTWLTNGYKTTWKDENGNIVGNEQNLVIAIERDVTYTATFEPATYKLTVSANDDNYGTVSATSGTSTGTTIQVGHNMDATITATANSDCKFVNWTLNGVVVSTENPYHIHAITDNVQYVAVFAEADALDAGYYRIAYDFPVAAAKASATRAATTQTYVISPSTGTNNGNDKISSWTYTKNGAYQADLTLTATCSEGEVNSIVSNASNGYFDLYVLNTADNYTTTFTLSVGGESYKITGYTMTYKVSSGSRVNIKNEYGYDTTPSSNSTVNTMEVNDINTNATTFTIATTNSRTGYGIYISNFTVTIQEVGSGEGGGETPEPEPETVRYYVQSGAVNATNNAMVMEMETEENYASSIFYYDGGKLLSYQKGTYVEEDGTTCGLQDVGVWGDVEIKIVDTNENEENICTIAAPNYMHANSNGYYVSNCGSDNGDAEHNFIIEEVTSLPVTISTAGYASWYAPVAVIVPDGLEAYYLLEKNIKGPKGDRYALMSKIECGVIPANEGVILTGKDGEKAEDKTYDFMITTIKDDSVEKEETDSVKLFNILEGTVATEYVTDDAYVLSKPNGKEIGFYLADMNKQNNNNTAFQNNSHKAYLPKIAVPGDVALSAGFRFSFGGTTTVEDVEIENEREEIYDLTGRKLEGISGTGIYIINGKKVLIK